MEESVEEAAGAEKVGARRPAHAREHAAFDAHARRVPGVRGLGHGPGIDRDAAHARAAKAERHQRLLAIEVEQARRGGGGAQRPGHARLVKARSGFHARRREPCASLHFEGDSYRFDHARAGEPAVLGDCEDGGERGRGRMVEGIPRIVEVEGMRHRSVGVRRARHGGLEAAGDDGSLRCAAHRFHVFGAEPPDTQRLGGAREHHGEAVERHLLRDIDGRTGQRRVAYRPQAIDEPSGQRVLHPALPRFAANSKVRNIPCSVAVKAVNRCWLIVIREP